MLWLDQSGGSFRVDDSLGLGRLFFGLFETQLVKYEYLGEIYFLKPNY